MTRHDNLMIEYIDDAITATQAAHDLEPNNTALQIALTLLEGQKAMKKEFAWKQEQEIENLASLCKHGVVVPCSLCAKENVV